MLQKLPKEFGCWGIEPTESAKLKLGEGEWQVGQVKEESNRYGEEQDVGGVEALGMF